jgi:hypothetical protein
MRVLTVTRRLGVVRGGKILDPRHHCGCAQPVAFTTSRTIYRCNISWQLHQAQQQRAHTLNVQRARQSDAVARPAAAVRNEVRRLRSAGRLIRVRKMVRAADEAGAGRTVVVGRKLRVLVSCPFTCQTEQVKSKITHTGALGGLDECKRDPVRRHSLPVDSALVVGDVDALRVGALLCGGRRDGEAGREEDEGGRGLHCGRVR